MSQKEWEQLREDMMIKCYVVGEGEVRYKLAVRDNLDRWIALRLDHSNTPIKAAVLLGQPELFSRLEN